LSYGDHSLSGRNERRHGRITLDGCPALPGAAIRLRARGVLTFVALPIAGGYRDESASLRPTPAPDGKNLDGFPLNS